MINKETSKEYEDTTINVKKLLTELQPIITRHRQGDVCYACSHILANLVQSVSVEKRKDLVSEINLIIEDGVKQIDTEVKKMREKTKDGHSV